MCTVPGEANENENDENTPPGKWRNVTASGPDTDPDPYTNPYSDQACSGFWIGKGKEDVE